MNKTILIGNLTKDAEISNTTSGVAVSKFTIAVKRDYKNANGEYETDFINCVAWRKLAENVSKYLTKGKKIAVIGSIQTRSYDAQDGSKRYVTEVIAEEIELLSSTQSGTSETKQPDKLTPVANDDNLPF